MRRKDFFSFIQVGENHVQGGKIPNMSGLAARFLEPRVSQTGNGDNKKVDLKAQMAAFTNWKGQTNFQVLV